VKLWLHTDVYLGSFFLEPEDIKSMSGGHLELKQSNRAPMHRNGGQRARPLRPRYIGTVGSRTQLLINRPHLAPRVKEEYSYVSTPPLGIRGLF